MELNQDIQMVGGITQIVMHPASAPLPYWGEVEAQNNTLVGEIIQFEPMSALYNEEVVLSKGQYIVTHTLSFVTQTNRSPILLEKLDNIFELGVVADVTLASGATIRLGYSDKHLLNAPLRLVKMNFNSGAKRSQYPTKEWTWVTTDSQPII